MKNKFKILLFFVFISSIGYAQKAADYVGHVTLLKKNITAIQVTSGTECPEGFEMKNGECMPITTLTTTSKTEGNGHVTLLKKNITAIRVTPGTDCPEGFILKNGECVPITTVTMVNRYKFGRDNRFLIYIGGGVFSPSTTAKEAGIVNGIDLNLSVYKPIWEWNNTSLGINAGGSYTIGNGDYTLNNRYTVYNLQGQNQPPTVSEKGTGSPKQAGFKFETGPQMNIHFGDVTVSPIFNVGYLNITQKSFSATETLYYNGSEYNYDLLTQKATKTSGLGIIPKIRFAYNITPKIGIWIEGSYIMGPKIETESTRFVLDPTIPSDSYNIGHFDEGQHITTKTKTNYNGIGINGGIVIGIGKGTKKTTSNEIITSSSQIEEQKLPIEIQKLIDEQDKLSVKNFEYVNGKPNQKTSSLCNFNIEKVDIQCNGKDQEGKKKYKVTITYKNLATSGVASLGHYLSACSVTTTNGNYLEVLPNGSASISNTLPTTTAKTIIPSGSSQSISFDFVPNSNFTSLNIKGNLISSATNCGNCDDIISFNLPACCDACELNPVTATNNSISVIDANAGTINIVNTVSSPNSIIKIQADLVAVKIFPANNSCNKCNDKVKLQDNFVDTNKLLNATGWKNGGQSIHKPDYPIGACRSLTYNSNSANGVTISSGTQIKHTIGVAPTSCCGDSVEIWIRYTLWDKDCKVCDKLVRSTITRNPACNNNGSGTGSSSSQMELNTNVKN